MKTLPAPITLRYVEPNRCPPTWRRVVVALCVAAWAAALAPADAAAAPAHAHRPEAAHVHPARGSGDCHGGMAHRAHAAGRRQAPARRHTHHTSCLDCCCASPGAHLPTPPEAQLATASALRTPVLAAADAAPHAATDFLHPFPNGPPSPRD